MANCIAPEPLTINMETIAINQQLESTMTQSEQSTLDQAILCAKVADEYRGQNTLVLDLTAITPVFDYFVITSATSPRQMHAIAEEVNRLLKQSGSRRLGLEGSKADSWILQDYGDIVLHVFNPEARALYDLEHLWADAVRIDWPNQD